MAEEDEEPTESENEEDEEDEVGEGLEDEDELPEPPVFLREEEPTDGEENKSRYWLLKDPSKTNIEVGRAHNLNENTVRIARNHLEGEGYLRKDQRPPRPQKDKSTGKALTTQPADKGIQVFAKGSPPEAIIQSISIPMVDGQSQGFEQGMKFGMTQLVLAVRIMQELSSIGLQQVKPLIDMTRSVREGETAAFKSGADEGAMKAARAIGDTMGPMMAEMQADIKDVTKGSSDADPMKGMMVRTMEPLLKRVMNKMMPGMEKTLPGGWSKKEE